MARVNTVRCDRYVRLAGVDLRDIRIKRLKLFAERHGAEDNPSKLGELIGKKPNQVYNLLHKQSSFGEKVARSIEEAAGLPLDWLDTDESQPVQGLSLDALEIATQIDRLPKGERDRVLRLCRELLKLAARSTEANASKHTASKQRVKAA